MTQEKLEQKQRGNNSNTCLNFVSKLSFSCTKTLHAEIWSIMFWLWSIITADEMPADMTH